MKHFIVLSVCPVFAAALLAAGVGGAFREHLGLQLYSLRAQFKSDPLHALDLAGSYGVTEVETAGVPQGMSAERFRELLAERGLKPVSGHFGYDRLDKDFAGVVKEARTLGVSYAICPWIPHEGKFTEPQARETAAKFNRWGAAFKAGGIKFGYHPHGYEFDPSSAGGGDKVLDVLIRETDPALVCFQMDVFWAYRAGADPVALLEKYPARWVMLHLKDIRRGAPRGPEIGSSAPTTDKVAIGRGEIDWPAVLRAAERIGVRHCFVEDECANPLESIPESFEYLRELKY